MFFSLAPLGLTAWLASEPPSMGPVPPWPGSITTVAVIGIVPPSEDEYVDWRGIGSRTNSPTQRRLSRRPPLLILHKRAKHLEVFQVRARIVIRRFEDEGAVREFWVLGHAPERVGADVAFADVPMPVDA